MYKTDYLPVEDKRTLIECPFCCGIPNIRDTGRNEIEIYCTKCFIGKKSKFLRLSKDQLTDILIDKWNNRCGP